MEANNHELSTIVKILKQIPLLAELNENDHQEIIKRITLEYFPKNYVVFNEGDSGDAFYIIKKGVVRIFHPHDNLEDDVEVSILGDNDFYGEMALISERPRNASAQTLEETEVFKLKKEDFINLVTNNSDMASRISSEFLKRLKINLRSNN